MWEGLVKTPLGSTPMRKFVSMFATLLVAIFGYSILASTPVFAASAEWKDDQIVYLDNTYEGPKTVTSGNIPRVEDNSTYYEFRTTQNNLEKAYVIYFAPGLDPPTEQSATLVEYQVINGSLTGPLSTNAITIIPQDSADPDGDSLATGELNSCQIESIGWIVCPATRHIAKGMDYIYGVISEFLEVKPLETTQQGALYAIWSMARNIANILFVIGFLILIYGQLTGGLASNYMIKKLLPRTVVAALMVNLSYWICAIGIDLSNILGYAVQDLFISVRNTVTQVPMDPVMWENATEFILTNGTVVAAGGIWTAAGIAATGGSIIAAVYLLIPALLGVVLAALVALIVLAMRQALIVILVIIAPLAFVAYLLPNTEKWFDRWRQTFMTMLLLFPIFSLIFGGSQLAGTAIVQTAQSPIIAILGMIVMVAPLVITPMVVKFSGSLLGRIAGMINNPNKGLIDRSRNWSRPRAELHRDKNLARKNTGFHRYGVGRVARRMKRSDITREKRHEGYKKGLENRAHEWESRKLERGPESVRRAVNNHQQRKNYSYWDEKYRDADLEHKKIDAHHTEHWQKGAKYATTPDQIARRQMMTDLQTSEGRANLYQESMRNEDERTFRREVEASRALSRVVKDSHHAKKQAEEFETIVQKAAEKSWNDRIRNDDATRALHLKAVRYTDGANVAEQKVTGIVENIKAVGDAAPGLVTPDDRKLAKQIKDLRREVEIEGEIQTSAKFKQQADLASTLKDDKVLRVRAAGVDEHGEVRVLAAAKKAVSDEMIKATNNFFDTMDYDLASNPAKLETAWRDAASRGEITEIIAYGRKLATNAPGLRKLKPLLEEFTRGKDPLSDDVLLLKEVLGADSTFRSAGRDLEVWANNETNPATGDAYTDFAEVRNAAAPWANITASRFASMNAYSQEEALYWLQQNAPDSLQALLDGIGNQNSQTWRDLKGSTRDKITQIRAGNRISNPN
jgi:hypothetical protein